MTEQEARIILETNPGDLFGARDNRDYGRAEGFMEHLRAARAEGKAKDEEIAVLRDHARHEEEQKNWWYSERSKEREKAGRLVASLEPEQVENYLTALNWDRGTPDWVRTIVIGNLRSFAIKVLSAFEDGAK